MSLFFAAESLRNWAKTHQSPALLPHIVRRLVSATVSPLTALSQTKVSGMNGVVPAIYGIFESAAKIA
jgi:hypothetical protein